MLPPWIIEKIKQEEEKKRRRDDRPQPQIQIDDEPMLPPPPPKEPDPDGGDRGVVIIDPGADDRGTRVGEVISFFSP